MSSIARVLTALEEIAPRRFAFPFDKVGLQLGDPSWPVQSVAVSLDWSEGLCDFMSENGAQLAICHHPLIWEPLIAVTPSTRAGQLALRMLGERRGFIACHTNWDSAVGGVNDALAAKLGLCDVSVFGSAADVGQYKLVTFAPRGHMDALIGAMSQAGAGKIGLYERCAYTSEGVGTYRALEGSNPSIGSVGKIETVEEIRIEMVLSGGSKRSVLQALKEVHPYDEPAYDLFPLEPLPEQPAGRVGDLPEPIALSAFVAFTDQALGTRSLAWGDPDRKVRRVAVVGGAADGEWRGAKNVGADVFVTGEVKQNVALDASEAGMAILASGHYATEQPGMAVLRDRLADALPELAWHLYEPKPGLGGRVL